MAKVVATPRLLWSHSQFTVPHSSSITNSCKIRPVNDVVSSSWLKTTSSKCYSRSLSLRRVSSFDFASFSDDEISRKIENSDFGFRFDDDDDVNDASIEQLNIEMKAKSVDLPLSLRMIKEKKKQWEGGLIDAKETTYCSMKKAFSSMVFILREIQSYTLQIRELVFFEDIKEILAKVESEMHASFVWLFEQVFSHTPTLMVYVMILLANFTVHSMSKTTSLLTYAAVMSTVEETENEHELEIELISLSDDVSETEEEEWEEIVEVEEMKRWKEMLKEASRMVWEVRETLDEVLSKRLVFPKLEADFHYKEMLRMDLMYQTNLEQDPDDVLLLVNYAQFLYVVADDYDRAEAYLKRALKIEPKDADTHYKYGNFLWKARDDISEAEEFFLKAIELAGREKAHYIASYACFLWDTGNDSICFSKSI